MFYPVNGDQYRSNVVLHLPMTGANNSTTFTDVSPTPKTITRNGDTKILTAQSKWGQGSGYFDGTGDYLTVDDHADLDFGTGDFCIEFYCYAGALAANTTFVGRQVAVSPGMALQIRVNASRYIQTVWRETSTATTLTGTILLPTSTWAHVAVSRASGVVRSFIDGVKASEDTMAYDLTSDEPLEIGAVYTNALVQLYTGYLQDLRITKGVALYTANFAVPVGPLASRLPELPIHRPIIQPPSFATIARLGL